MDWLRLAAGIVVILTAAFASWIVVWAIVGARKGRK